MTVSVGSIRPGDVLLFHGKGFVPWAIRKGDGSEVNHSAIALPDGTLAEAGGNGLARRALPTSFSDDDYMLVRRHLCSEPSDLVVKRASAFLDEGHFYAYQQIVLLAVLGLTRKIPAQGLARRMIRSALDHAARAVMDLLPLGASWMICSEYVYRCFDESADQPPNKFLIEIAGVNYAGPTFGEAASADGTWLGWAIAQDSTATIEPGLAFGVTMGGDADAAAEDELAPLIAEWAQFAGIDPSDPLPANPTTLSFATPIDVADPAVRKEAELRQRDEVSDRDLRDAMVMFSETLKAARTSTPGMPVEFGILPGTVAAAAAKGALTGLRSLSVDANFVTPRDLLMSHSLSQPERVA